MLLYGVSVEDIMSKLNAKRKVLLTEKQVFNTEVKISWIKKIDEFFNKGISYYSDPKNPTNSKDQSIFFRKDNFNAKLSLGAKQIVNKFEEDKIAFSTLAKLSDFKINRTIPVFKLSENPQTVAKKIRDLIYPEFNTEKREFLKNLIAKFAEYNILVFEFVETHNKKEKANINGFFLTPNVIVLKRNQKFLKREIFTLAHELGHYLLNEEEIDENINEGNIEINKLSKIERWCNDFAYYFLAGDYSKTVEKLDNANSQNDYHNDIISTISRNTQLSTISIYTRLLLNNQISPSNYSIVSNNISESIKAWELKEKQKQEIAKQKALDEGRKIIIPPIRPLISPLYLKTLQNALYSGLINEADFCKKINIDPKKIEKYLV